MSKIGILTFHRSYNYGAFMQCYSLSHKLKEDFPYDDIEVIDYVTDRMYQNYPTKLRSYIFGEGRKNSVVRILKNTAKIIREPKMLTRKRILYSKFEEDLKYLPLSKAHIQTNDVDVFFQHMKDKYDVIIAGSDAIWEYMTYPFPNVYFLNGDLGHTKRISFAASSGRMTYSKISEAEKKYLKESYEKFCYLGVRDVSTEDFTSKILNRTCYRHNCDPTFLINLSDLPKNLDRVKTKLEENNIDLTKPIIGIMGGDSICKMVRKMFGKKYQIVAVYYYTKYADYYIDDLSPIEWAQIFSIFSVTITRFFHGSLLSLMNGCPTIATDFWCKIDDRHDTKIEDLYKRLNLSEHYFYMKNYDDNMQNRIKDSIEHYINFPDTDKILNAVKKEAESYHSFKNVLSGILCENEN